MVRSTPEMYALADGRVVAARGSDLSRAVEIFDPSANGWSNVAVPPAMVFLGIQAADGRLLFRDERNFALIDPAARVATLLSDEVASEDYGSYYQYALFPDGRALVCGKRCRRWDPHAARWSAAATMHLPRMFHSMTVLADGRVLAFGGSRSAYVGEQVSIASAEIYDPSTDRWAEVAAGAPQRSHSATLLPDGRVIMLGGQESLTEISKRAQIYDPTSDTWTLLPDMPVARASPAVAVREDGTLLVAAGVFAERGASQHAEVLNAASGAWWSLPVLTVADGARGVAVNGAIYTVGAMDGASRVVKLTLADP